MGMQVKNRKKKMRMMKCNQLFLIKMLRMIMNFNNLQTLN